MGGNAFFAILPIHPLSHPEGNAYGRYESERDKGGIAELRLRYGVPIVKVGASMEKARPQFRD